VTGWGERKLVVCLYLHYITLTSSLVELIIGYWSSSATPLTVIKRSLGLCFPAKVLPALLAVDAGSQCWVT